MSWTDQKVQKLKELWSKGHTASQIAEALGDTTRNAVIGKAHRLNLEARAPSKQSNSSRTGENKRIRSISIEKLDYYTETNKAYLYGPTKIIGEDYDIYCEQGFYDTNIQQGYFKKNAEILYNNKIINGDSLYFDRNQDFASATNNIKVVDTANSSVITTVATEISAEFQM